MLNARYSTASIVLNVVPATDTESTKLKATWVNWDGHTTESVALSYNAPLEEARGFAKQLAEKYFGPNAQVYQMPSRKTGCDYLFCAVRGEEPAKVRPPSWRIRLRSNFGHTHMLVATGHDANQACENAIDQACERFGDNTYYVEHIQKV